MHIYLVLIFKKEKKKTLFGWPVTLFAICCYGNWQLGLAFIEMTPSTFQCKHFKSCKCASRSMIGVRIRSVLMIWKKFRNRKKGNKWHRKIEKARKKKNNYAERVKEKKREREREKNGSKNEKKEKEKNKKWKNCCKWKNEQIKKKEWGKEMNNEKKWKR